MTELAELAENAAQHWGGITAPVQLISHRENAVFEALFTSGQRAALRLHRTGYQTAETIRSELIWTEQLAQSGFPCPRPIRTEAGELLVQIPDGPLVSAVSWIDAKPIGRSETPYNGTIEQYHALGRLIARMHSQTRAMDLQGIDRPFWDVDALLGPDPHWGRFWDNPALTKPEQGMLQEARKNAALDLNALDPILHLIHADLLQENILSDDARLWIIDFDDSGLGYAGYDLGTALVQHAEHPKLADLTAALCAGYCHDHAAPVAAAKTLTDQMPLWIMLRSMASAGWIISRAEPGDPKQRYYAERMLRCAATYLT
jgi:Ser/Thr protein kinase RdoA (MazF antagonist)